MKSFTLRVWIVGALFLLLSMVGSLPTQSDAGRTVLDQKSEIVPRKRTIGQGSKPLSYRSPGTIHKLLIPDENADLKRRLLSSRGARKSKKYGSYSLIEVSDSEISLLNGATLERAHLRDDLNLIMLKRGQIDTTGPEPSIDRDLRHVEKGSLALHLVQLFGPPTPDSLRALMATGAAMVGYIPNNAYLLWTTRAQRQRISELRQSTEGATIVQWDGPYHPAYKVSARLNLDSIEQIASSVEIFDTPNANETVEFVRSKVTRVLTEFRAAGAVRMKIVAPPYVLKELAQVDYVIGIEPWSPMKLMDERADQIVAGSLSSDMVNSIQVSRPTGPGYLSLLSSLGFNSTFDFAIDIADTGFDLGTADASKVHPDFLDPSGASRVAYLHDFTEDSHPNDTTILPSHDAVGHGTINASIAAGYSDRSGGAFVDGQGFQYGLGIAPFARIGVTKLFPDARSTSAFSYAEFIAAAYRAGARVSNNSWGICDDGNGFCNLYVDDTQVFDSLVRDADFIAPGNQSMTILFASGNDGDINAPSVAIPGTAKNVITVGLSENVRGTETDGCGVRGVDADNAEDIVFFSGWGPVQDGRAKPDLVAPGSHMQGAATQDKIYASASLSDIAVCNKFFPEGQTLYTWSSGTSHSTPLVAGGAALAYQWLRTSLGSEPSPALIKAFILNSTSYLKGRFAGDNLPGARQGWGLLNISRMFESTNRIILDESPSRTFRESGGAPFEATGAIDDPSKEFRVMLAWTDPPGNPATNAPYVNQLNLEVVVGGVVYNGNHFSSEYSMPGGQTDFANNVQGVRLPRGTTGPFVVRVKPTIIAGDGVPGNESFLDQDFALVVTNGRAASIPVLSVESAGDVSAGIIVQHSAGDSNSSLIPGEFAKLKVTVRNQSPTTTAMIQNAVLALNNNQSSATFGSISPGGTGSNNSEFEIQVPSSLRCGSVATLQLQLDTNGGRFTLPVRVQVGRLTQPDAPTATLFFEDVDGSRVKWKKKGGFGVADGIASSGTMSFHTEDPGLDANDIRHSQLTTKKAITIPENAGQVRLSFFHIFNFEPGYDGGVLEISADDGDFQDAGALILVGGYDGTLTETSENPLGTRAAWTARGRPGVFSQVVVDLSQFAGKRIKLRFRGGFDFAAGVLNGYTGWFIDDVQITASLYSCSQT